MHSRYLWPEYTAEKEVIRNHCSQHSNEYEDCNNDGLNDGDSYNGNDDKNGNGNNESDSSSSSNKND